MSCELAAKEIRLRAPVIYSYFSDFIMLPTYAGASNKIGKFKEISFEIAERS